MGAHEGRVTRGAGGGLGSHAGVTDLYEISDPSPADELLTFDCCRSPDVHFWRLGAIGNGYEDANTRKGMEMHQHPGVPRPKRDDMGTIDSRSL